MAETEKWLQADVPDAYIELDGFTLGASGQRSGQVRKILWRWGCVYINDRCCGCITLRETISDRDVELLCNSLQPFICHMSLTMLSSALFMCHLMEMQ